MITETEFTKAITGLFQSTNAYGADLYVKIRYYYPQFKDLELRNLSQAVNSCIKKYKDFPSVKEILDEMPLSAAGAESDAVAESIAFEVCKNATYGNPSGEILKKADDGELSRQSANAILLTVKCMGGWSVLGNSRDGDPFIRTRFREVYAEMKHKDEARLEQLLNPGAAKIIPFRRAQ